MSAVWIARILLLTPLFLILIAAVLFFLSGGRRKFRALRIESHLADAERIAAAAADRRVSLDALELALNLLEQLRREQPERTEELAARRRALESHRDALREEG